MKKFEVMVIGGGLTGCAAAIAAARNGSKVLLVERINGLGGAPCTMGVNPFMHNATKLEGDDAQTELSQGIMGEIRAALQKEGAMQANVFNPEYLKIVLNRMTLEAGVTLLFNTQLVCAERVGNKVKSVTVANKAGLSVLEADYFIDCTGDADLAYYAGFPTRLGRPEDSLCQPMTLNFQIANVDMEKFNAVRREVVPMWQKEKEKGYIKNPMDSIMLFNSCFDGIINLNATRVVKKNPVDPFELTQADIEAREQMVELHTFLKNNVSGFENSKILYSAPNTGVRESRMIDGEHILTAEELVACTKFEDAIAAGNYDIDIHNPEGSGTSHYFFAPGEYYTVPYRCLVPKASENLLVAGRCISTTHEAQASIRILYIVCTLGEAAGTAAAIACKNGQSVKEIDQKLLQTTLKNQGAFLGI